MKKERLMNMAGVLVFYLILILGVVAINTRMNHINSTGVTASVYNK